MYHSLVLLKMGSTDRRLAVNVSNTGRAVKHTDAMTKRDRVFPTSSMGNHSDMTPVSLLNTLPSSSSRKMESVLVTSPRV